MSSYERSLEDNYEMLKKQLTAKQQQQQQQQQRHQPSPSPPPPLVRSASDSSGSKPESVVGIGREIKRITIEDERKKKLQEMLRKQQHHLQQQQHQARRAQYPLAVAAQQPSQKLSRIVSRNSSSASATTTMTGGVKSTGAKSVSSSSSSSLSQPPSLMSTPTLPAASRALVSSSSSSVSHLPPPDPSDMSNRIASLLEDNDKFVDKHRRKQLAAAAAVAAQKTSTHLSTFSSNTANITPSALMLSRIKSKRSESADSNDIQDDHHFLGSFRSQSSSTTTSSTRSLTPTRPPAILSSQPQHHHYQTTSGAASKLLLPSSSSFGSSSTSSIRSASSTTPTNRLMSSSSSHHHHHNHHQNHPHKVEHNYKFKRICSMALKLFGTYNTAGSSGGNSGGLAANEDEDKPVSSSSPSLASYSNDISNDVLMNVDMAAAALRYDYESMMAKAHSVAAAASSSSSRASSCAAEVRSSSDSVDQDDISRLARVKSLRKIAAAVNSGAAVVASQKLTTFQPQLPIQQTQSQQQKQLTPDMAARRIQAAFRQHLARRNPQFYSGCRPQQQQQQQQQQQEASIRRIQSINQCLTKLDMNTNQHHLKSKSLSIGLELCGSGAGGIENRPIGGGSIINRSLKPLAVIAKQQQQINAQITPVSTATIRTTASITTTRGSDYFLEDFHVEKLTSTATSGELKLPQQQQPSMVKFNASRFEYDEFAPVRKLSSSIRSKSESITASALSASATANANHMIASKSSGSSSTSSSSLSDMATAANLMMRRKTNRMSKLDSELAEMAVKAYSLTGINASSSTTSTTTATTSAKSNLDPHEALEAVVHLQAKLAPSKLAAAATASSSDENNLFKATAKSGTRVSAASYSSSSSSSSSNCSSASSTSSSSSSSSHSTLNEKEMNPESSEIVTPVLLAVENESKLKALRRHQTAPQSQQIARGVLLSESRRTMSNSSDPAQIQYTDDVVSGLEEFAASTTTTTTTPTKNGVSTNDLALDKSFRQLLLPSIEGHGKKSSSLQHRVVADALIASMNKELAAVAAADANEAINTACSSGSSTSTAAATAAAIGGFFEDDSFKKFMDELIHKFMREEETRNKHYAHMLKLREKALIQKTQAELACLEEFKLKAQEKCEDEKMLQILSKERTIKQKLRQEQENINKMKEAQRQASESRLAMILSQHHSELVRWCQNKLKQQQQSQQTDVRTETATTATTTTSTAANNEEEKMNESSSISNQSLNEAVRRNFKIHLNPERYLTVREKKLRMRRKQAEDIISWKKKLDDEEMKVREIEKKANSMLTTPTPVKAAVESVSSPVRVVQDQIKTDLNENNESEEAKTNLEKSGRTKELESKVRELQREMLKKKGEAEKLRQTLELKEKEDKMRKNRKSGSDSIVDRVDEENSSTTSVSITDIESSINSKPIVNESSPKVSQTETSDIQPSPALIEYEQSSNEVESGSKIEEKSVEEDINKDEVISSEIVIEESIKERYVYEEEEEEYDGKNSIIASQDSLAIQTTLMESSALSSSVKPISVGIHQDAEKISQLCNVLVANYYWKRLDRLKLLVVAQLEEDEMDVRDSLDFDADLREYFDEPIGLLFSSTTSSSRSSSPNNHEDEDVEDEMNFKLMLLHLVGELMLDLYSERFEQDEQDDELDLFVSSYHIKGQRKLHFKSVLKGPSRLEEAQKLISIKVADYLLKQPPKSATVAIASETSLHQHHIHDNSSSLTSVISTRSKWHQQRRLELFDTVLNRELREQEYEWSNYEAEEYETKMLVADAIFNSILHDTIDAFQISFIKKHT